MRSSRNHRRAGTATVLAGFVTGAVLGLTACGAGDGDPSARPSAGAASIDRPSREPEAETSAPAEPTRTRAEPTRSREPDPTTEPPEAAPPPPTSAAAVPPAPTRATRTTPPAEAAPPPAALPPAASTPAPSPSAAAAAESGGVGPFGWLVLIGLVAALIIGGVLVSRSRRRTAWDAEATALAAETRTVTATRLAPVLTATTAGQRGLAWPPVRDSLVDLVARWNALTERASGDTQMSRSLQISGLLQDLIAAVDAENEALATGRDWTLLRPKVIQADQALAAALADQPQTEPPPAGEPGPPVFQP